MGDKNKISRQAVEAKKLLATRTTTPPRDSAGRFVSPKMKGVAVRKPKPKVKAEPKPEPVSVVVNAPPVRESFTLNDLYKKIVKKGMIVDHLLFEVENQDVPAIAEKSRFAGHNVYKVQPPRRLEGKHILITHMADYVNIYDAYQVTYVTDPGKNPNVIYLPHDFKIMTALEGEEKTKFMDGWDKWLINNIPTQLGHTWYVGSDPEIFVEDATNGACIPAWEFLPDKKNPAKTTVTGYGSMGGTNMYWDGYQGEFTTHPTTCLSYHVDSIAAGLHGVYHAAKAKFPNAKLSIKSVFEIPRESLASASAEHVEFGCMPSLNVYGIKVDMPPAREVNFRSAGGHIHFGLGKMTQTEAAPIVKALDAILGVACVSLFANYDSPIRRKMYGLPGEYRLPPHGLEYRPLSNAWLCHPLITNLVIDFARKVVMLGQRGMLRYWKGTEAETLDCMINCDVNKAREILTRNKELVLKLFNAAYWWANNADTQEFLFSIWMNGIESVIDDPSDIVGNWQLDGKTKWVCHNDGKGKNVATSYVELMAKFKAKAEKAAGADKTTK